MRNTFTLIFFLLGATAFAQTSDLQKLIDRTPNGGTVLLPPGRHVIDKPLQVSDRTGLTIKGDENTKVLCSDVWQAVFMINNSQSIRLEGLYLSHEKPMKDYQCNGGVLVMDNCQRIVVQNCELEGSGTIGVSANNVDDLHVHHCYIHDNTFNAFYIQTCSEILITSNVVQNNANFIQLYNSDGFEMSDNLISGNGGYWRDKDPKPGITKQFRD